MSMKKPGRIELICIKCENKFKTHSTNRERRASDLSGSE